MSFSLNDFCLLVYEKKKEPKSTNNTPKPLKMGNGASDSCCGLWTVDNRRCIERADRLHKSELYACRSWVYNVRHVERLLKKKRVAPFERGVCFLSPPGFVECPICFLVWKDPILITSSHSAQSCWRGENHFCFSATELHQHQQDVLLRPANLHRFATLTKQQQSQCSTLF